MVGIYLSGTGNTKHCIEKLVSLLDKEAKCVPLESPDAGQAIKDSDFIIFGYPTQYSNAPLFVRDYIKTHSALWKNKKILCVATMGLFSGDGAGCTARLFKKFDAHVLGGLHIRMPDSVCDSKALKKSLAENKRIVAEADKKIEYIASRIKNGKFPKDGLNIFYHIAGLFGQRLWFYGKTKHYSDKLKFNADCIGCGLCAKNCPMNNIQMQKAKPVSQNHCTMCYRCINACPKQAITLIGKKVVEQSKFNEYQ